jgi:hypothetical protein
LGENWQKKCTVIVLRIYELHEQKAEKKRTVFMDENQIPVVPSNSVTILK